MDKKHTIENYRKELALIDAELISLLHQRAKMSEHIAEVKFATNAKIKQARIWSAFNRLRNNEAKKLGLDKKLFSKIFKLIHKDSIKIQKNKFKELRKNEK